MNSQPISFETIREHLVTLPTPKGSADRSTLWIVDRVVGIARTATGRLEVFLVGAVHAALPHVRRHLERGEWSAPESGETFAASRIVLPEGGHFEAIATVIVIELLRNGPVSDSASLQNAFSAVEPIIELALRNLALAEASVLGLLGELLVLEQLLIGANALHIPAAHIVAAWRGHERGARDFVIGNLAIEVKTTSLPVSRHRLSNLGQIEPRVTQGGVAEQIMLVSIGLTQTPLGQHSVAAVTDRILDRFKGPAAEAVRVNLLSNLIRYTTEPGVGYDHASMRTLLAYQRGHDISFTPRLYDLSDQEVKLLRAKDLAGTFVDVDDVEYAFTLPERVNEKNPVRSWQQVVAAMLRHSKMTDSPVMRG